MAVALVAGLAGCGSSPAPTATAPGGSSAGPAPSAVASASPVVPATPGSLPSPTSTAASSAATQRGPALQAALDRLRAAQRLPGIQAAVVFPDGSVWSGANGYADVATRAPVTTRTFFSVGSITKTLVAALTLRLVDQGEVGLDDPISRWLPTFPNAAHITVRELLGHRAGVADYFDNAACVQRIVAAPAVRWSVDQVLACVGRPYFAPGTGFHYSNTDYVLIGLIDERASGSSLADLLRLEFVIPYGLDAIVLQSEAPPDGSLAHGYLAAADPGGEFVDVTGRADLLPYPSLATAAGAAGAVASDAQDVARWAGALFGGQVLDTGTLHEMVTFLPTRPDPRGGYGLGVEPFQLDGRTAWGHRGHLAGFWSETAYLPAEGLALAVLTNGDWATPDTLAAGLVAAALPATPVASPSPAGSHPAATASPGPGTE